MGKLIVLEGTDGSGKSTQFARLTEHLQADGQTFERIVFPQYSEPSSALLRMYLAGEFGTKPTDVNAYAASAFYAVDRYASYKKVWGSRYESGELILADRYTTSNAVHQASKVPEASRGAFYDWLCTFEYEQLGLPKPDLVLYLDVPTAVSERLLRHREAQTHTSADIHEQDSDYLAQCRQSAMEAADYYGWKKIACTEQGVMRSVEDIHREIYQAVKEIL